MNNIALVYMAAGISSRFGGKIKQLAQVGPAGESLIEYSLNQALSVGFNKVIFIVGEKTERPIKELIGNNYKGVKVDYAFQEYYVKERDKPWGTVDALCSASGLIDCSFVVCNGDDIYGGSAFKTLVQHLQKENDEATIAYKLIDALPENGLTNRGVFKISNGGYVQSVREVFNIDKRDLGAKGVSAEDLCSQNIFAFHPKIVEMLEDILKEFKERNKGERKIECLLPNEISRLLDEGKIRIKAYHVEEKWLGITNPGDEEVVKNELLRLGERNKLFK